MPDQPSLFEERKRRDASSESGYVYVQQAKQGHAKEAARQALDALGDERENLRKRYARLLWKAATKGVRLQSDTGMYKTVDALTDKEAASLLSCEKTTINARRAELMGDEERYEACPVVVEAGKRESLVMGTGLENATYTINPLLIGASE